MNKYNKIGNKNMGIESFFGGYIRANYKQCIERKLPDKVSSLFVDCNGIFHHCAQKVYGYGDFEGAGMATQDTNTLNREIQNKIEEVLKVCAPENNFILAPDGVAVAAKLNQQKSRRFISAATRTISFDSNQFTPGTDLMIKLDEKLRGWLKFNKKMLPKNIIYSSHLDPGEGEHKIFQFIRENKIIKGDGAHVLYGLDSDLIILSLLCPLDNIYLMREDYRSLVNIDKLREMIKDKFEFEGCNRSRLIKDFSILLMFAGNDFLPKLPSFTSINNYVEIFTRLYKTTKKHIVNEGDDIDFQVVHKILSRFVDVETRLMAKIVKESLHKYPYPELIKSVTIDGKFDEQKFTNLWYCKQFCPATGELASMYEDNKYYTEAEIGKMSVEFLKTMQWVHKYYSEGHKNISNTHFYPYIYAPIGKSLHSILSMIYTDKRRTKTRIKKLQDVGPSKNIDITAAHQLLSVIPRRSSKIIPVEVMNVYDNYMDIIMPEEFVIKHEGTNLDWHRTAVIPPVNMNLVSYALVQDPKYSTPDRLKSRPPLIFENTEYISKQKMKPGDVKRRMDKFVKTTSYSIKDVQLI
jgi:5'-3' exoribonuclease 1